MARTPNTDRTRLLALDGLRGLACAAIVLVHVWMFDYGDAGRGPKSALDLAIGELRLAVPLFFVLSGFLVYAPFVAAALEGRRRPALRRYAMKRAARILPAYWAAVLGCFVLLRWLDHPFAVSAQELPWYLLFLQNHSTQTLNRLDPPMWTLAVEVSFYVLVPVVGLLAARLGRGRARQAALGGALVALGALLVAAAWGGDWPVTVTTSLVGNLTSFAAGMTAAALVHRRRLRRRTGLALVAAGVALVVADGAWHALQLTDYAWRAALGDQPAAIGFALIVAGLAAAPLRALPLTVPPLTTLGTLSYGAYLWHFPAIYALRAWGWMPSQLLLAYGATMALTLAAAVVSWCVVERPAIGWAQRRRPAPAPRELAAGRRGWREPEPSTSASR